MDRKRLVNRRTRRTTLTLEADVTEYLLEKLAQNRDLKEKDLVNDLLRKGIKAASTAKADPLRISPFKSSLVSGVDPDKIEQLLDEV
jgi:predicted DNA-binding ribbon-helix-helix protein